MNNDLQCVCGKDMCAGCMRCIDTCPVGAISLRDSIDAYNAVIDLNRCVKCGKCHKLCPQNSQPELKKPLEWYQGWSKDLTVRANSASGGIATEIASKFIQNGGEVCTCIFDNGNFVFRFFDKVDDLSYASGSKYVKSNPHGIYKDLSDKLENGKKVLMVGLPCQISADKKFINRSHNKNFYTIDLVCHGTPSPNLLNLFLKGKNVAIKDIKAIHFREKNKGISLILCQTMNGKELLSIANAEFLPVDIERAINNNMNLKGPSIMPVSGDRFFSEIKKGKSFHKAMLCADPKWVIKYKIKRLFPWAVRIKQKLRGGGYADNNTIRYQISIKSHFF